MAQRQTQKSASTELREKEFLPGKLRYPIHKTFHTTKAQPELSPGAKEIAEQEVSLRLKMDGMGVKGCESGPFSPRKKKASFWSQIAL